MTEAEFWGDCANTMHEEQKQLVYAPRMGLIPILGGAHPPTFNLKGHSVIDLGGGPVSLLLKCIDKGRAVVVDPGEWPQWVIDRYQHCGVEYWRQPAEEVTGYSFDEAWIYNVLQHVKSPKLVIQRAQEIAEMVRIFEWIDIPAYEGHPHMLTEKGLNKWLKAEGFTVELNENGAVGRAYYGVYST
jgi:hypothetical protein